VQGSPRGEAPRIRKGHPTTTVTPLNVLLRRSTFDKRYPQSGRIRGHRGSREGVQDGYAGGLVVGHVAGHHGEAVYQCRRRDLLVQRILRMWNPQPPPYLRDLRIEGEDRVSVLPGDRAEPTRQASRPRDVATMAHSLNALTQLADRNRREEQRDALRRSIPKEPTNAGLARVRLRALLMTSVSTRYMCRPHARRSVCRRSKSASSPTSGIAASTSASERRLGCNSACSRISRCSCSAL
jgi:hypothetical protein